MKKKILITGATDGIGRLVAIELANQGHQVYIHGRNPEKVEQAIEEIKKSTGNTQVEAFIADFSDLNAVKSMSREVTSKISELDVLINNAGVFNSPVSVVGSTDIRFLVNYLAPVLLTHSLLPILRNSSNPRIINLGSAAQAPVSTANLKSSRNLSAQQAYAQSKLAFTMWTFHLSHTVQDINSIVVNPGSLLDTKMAKEAFGQVWSPAEKGSDIMMKLALSAEYSNASGKYYDNDKGGFGNAHPEAYQSAKVTELIEVTKEVLKIEM